MHGGIQLVEVKAVKRDNGIGTLQKLFRVRENISESLIAIVHSVNYDKETGEFYSYISTMKYTRMMIA